ncbi:MAG: aldo/keto reductase [Acidobacteriota bacterium]|nr:aldo/keto reductase [Acidobacteriota bacterium]
MQRRTFLAASSAALALNPKLLADTPMPMSNLGQTGMRVSRITVGGYHMRVRSQDEGVRIVHRAIDLGVNLFDCAHLYHDGKSEETYGVALVGGLRQKIHLMTKAEIYTYDGAFKELEESLTRMKTDYLDLWCCHQVSTMSEVDQILGPRGSLQAFVKAKEQGKVRHIGFTGHYDPEVHLRMLRSFDGWETVQHPVNLVDPYHLSFIGNVLPKVREKGLGMLAMKSNAMGGISEHHIAPISECLRFTWSQDIDTLVSGVETVQQLEENVLACKTFRKMTGPEMTTLLNRTKKGPVGAEVEKYKKA